jgi:hypothetical protein
MQRTLLPSRPRALGATSRLHPTVCRIRHVQLDDLHTRNVDAGHKIAEVTQLHSKCLIGDKLCLSLRQELSNPRCNKPSHCFLQSPKKLKAAWARTGRRELPQEHNHMSASSWRWRENRVREELYKQQLKNMNASTNGTTLEYPNRAKANEITTIKEPITRPSAKG